jgi:hypothetical protein
LQILQLLKLLLLLLYKRIHAIRTHNAPGAILGCSFILLFNNSAGLLLEGAVDDVVDAFLLAFHFLNFCVRLKVFVVYDLLLRVILIIRIYNIGVRIFSHWPRLLL